MKGTEIDFAKRRIQFSGTTKKEFPEVANENTLYRATIRLKVDTVDVSERLSTNSKKIEYRSIEARGWRVVVFAIETTCIDVRVLKR